MTNSSSDDLREQYLEQAKFTLRHSLVLRELLSAQKVEVSDDDIEARLEQVIAGYGANHVLRQMFDTPQMRGNIGNELMITFCQHSSFRHRSGP